MFTQTQLLRNRRGQRPSNKGELDWSVTREVLLNVFDLMCMDFCLYMW
jgi:hypothetical protein